MGRKINRNELTAIIRECTKKAVNMHSVNESAEYETLSDDARNIYLCLDNNDGQWYNWLFRALKKKCKRGVEITPEVLAKSRVLNDKAREMAKRYTPEATMQDRRDACEAFSKKMIQAVIDDCEMDRRQAAGELNESRMGTWRGIPGTTFIWNGDRSDSEIEYNGEITRTPYIEDSMWESFKSQGGNENATDEEFNAWCCSEQGIADFEEYWANAPKESEEDHDDRLGWRKYNNDYLYEGVENGFDYIKTAISALSDARMAAERNGDNDWYWTLDKMVHELSLKLKQETGEGYLPTLPDDGNGEEMVNEMAYKRVTSDEYTIQGDYGQGWEDVSSYGDRVSAKKELRLYGKNERGVPHRLVKRRVKNDVNESKLNRIIKESVKKVLNEDEKDNIVLGNNESGETLYQVELGCNDYDSTKFNVFAYNEQEALDTAVDFLEQNFGNDNGYFYDDSEEAQEYPDEFITAGNHGHLLRSDMVIIHKQ